LYDRRRMGTSQPASEPKSGNGKVAATAAVALFVVAAAGWTLWQLRIEEDRLGGARQATSRQGSAAREKAFDVTQVARPAPAPPVLGWDQAGKPFTVADARGQVVFVNFWATWCGPCRGEIPGMTRVYDKYKTKGFEIVGVALDNGGWDDVKPWLQKNPINYPIVIGDQSLTDAYGGVEGIPTTFIVDRKGNIQSKHVGGLREEEFEKLVKTALQ